MVLKRKYFVFMLQTHTICNVEYVFTTGGMCVYTPVVDLGRRRSRRPQEPRSSRALQGRELVGVGASARRCGAKGRKAGRKPCLPICPRRGGTPRTVGKGGRQNHRDREQETCAGVRGKVEQFLQAKHAKSVPLLRDVKGKPAGEGMDWNAFCVCKKCSSFSASAKTQVLARKTKREGRQKIPLRNSVKGCVKATF